MTALRYGVQALGITLSQNQATLANERIARAGLQDRCRVEVRDYRDVNTATGFDKLVSVGMVEHVGESRLPVYFQHAWQLLRPGGVFLNHGIARRTTDPEPAGPTFISRYVFPDGELVDLNTMLRYAEEAAYEVRDVESLRDHYTLAHRCLPGVRYAHSEKDATFFKGRNRPGVVDTGKRPRFPLLREFGLQTERRDCRKCHCQWATGPLVDLVPKH